MEREGRRCIDAHTLSSSLCGAMRCHDGLWLRSAHTDQCDRCVRYFRLRPGQRRRVEVDRKLLSGTPDSSSVEQELSKLTISNVGSNDVSLIAHVVFTYFYSVVAYVLIYLYYVKYTRLRQKYLNKLDVKSFSVILQNIPKRMRFEDSLRGWFDEHFDGIKVVDVRIVWDDAKLRYAEAQLPLLNQDSSVLTHSGRVNRSLKRQRIRYLNKLERAEEDVAEFHKFEREWNKQIRKRLKEREKLEWEATRSNLRMLEMNPLKREQPQTGSEPKIKEEENFPAEAYLESEEGSTDGSTASPRAVIRNNGPIQQRNGSRRGSSILTLSGVPVPYDALPSPKKSLGARSARNSTRSVDSEDEQSGEHLETLEEGDPGCLHNFAQGWRKYVWKLKNLRVCRPICGDLGRKSNKVPYRVARMIENEVRSALC